MCRISAVANNELSSRIQMKIFFCGYAFARIYSLRRQSFECFETLRANAISRGGKRLAEKSFRTYQRSPVTTAWGYIMMVMAMMMMIIIIILITMITLTTIGTAKTVYRAHVSGLSPATVISRSPGDALAGMTVTPT